MKSDLVSPLFDIDFSADLDELFLDIFHSPMLLDLYLKQKKGNYSDMGRYLCTTYAFSQADEKLMKTTNELKIKEKTVLELKLRGEWCTKDGLGNI
jgi:hypothetical protein